jgi:hypothetical protein
MKHIIFILSLVFVFTACKDKREPLKLAAEEFYILEIGAYWDIGNKYDQLLRLVEIDSMFNVRITMRKDISTPYCSDTIHISDSLKMKINKIINSYQSDSLYEGDPRIYDGSVYLFMIKHKAGNYIGIRGIRPDLPDKLKEIQAYFFNDSILNKINRIDPNQDSIIHLMHNLPLYEFAPPPPPLRIKFRPSRLSS